MFVLPLFAFLSGMATILSPCILPVLPILLAGGGSGGKRKPLGVAVGFTAGFTAFTLALSWLVSTTGIPPDSLRWIAIVAFFFAGCATLFPKVSFFYETLIARTGSAVSSLFSSFRNKENQSGKTSKPRHSEGFGGGVLLGLGLAVAWTPCVGPIMASVISLAVASQVDTGSVFITLSYALGALIPMLAVLLGGRKISSKISARISGGMWFRKATGIMLALVALALAFQLDRKFQTAIIRAFPGYGQGLVSLEDSESVRKALDSRRLDEFNRSQSASGEGTSGEGTSGEGNQPGQESGRTGNNSLAFMNEGIFSGIATSRLGGGVLGEYGLAPDFPSLLSKPDGTAFDPSILKGKVVIVDFWTYSCINCVRTLPTLAAWNSAWSDSGLVILGVHTPEFAFERSGKNVAKAMDDLGVTWPVVLDNEYEIWRSFGNQYWPAQYFIDTKGRVRYWHFGEGGYAESEKIIKLLLAEAGYLQLGKAGTVSTPEEKKLDALTPELYLGYARGRGFASIEDPVNDAQKNYTAAENLSPGQWALQGQWKIASEHSESIGEGKLSVSFDAKDVYLVIEPVEKNYPGENKTKNSSPDTVEPGIRVLVDRKPGADTADVQNGVILVQSSRLYHLASFDWRGVHTLELQVPEGYRLFAFTFG